MARGFALHAGTAPEVIEACAREAEGLGYRSFWVNYPGGGVDGLGVLALAARQTQRIELGVGVVPLHLRDAGSIADGVRALGLPLDRLLLGVGSPNPGALDRVRRGVAALRRDLPVRLVVAALGPRMCHLAGEVADAVLLNWLTPAHARRSAEWVRAGAGLARRPSPRVLAYVRLALGSTAGARLREEGARYAAIPAYAAHFARMGTPPLTTALAAPDAAGVPALLDAWRGAVDEVIVRALPAGEGLAEHLELLRAARPG
jgi:alkanesulfonate monooxygenase SsuD/methylene tetrahydromethanopterin reductase-like flavin-dependent oxidoreductase (luciferase family)